MGFVTNSQLKNVQQSLVDNLKSGKLMPANAGHADTSASLDTELGVDDETPFAYQTAGGESDITTGMQQLKKLVGCKIVKNQWMGTISSASASVQDSGLTISVDSETNEVVITGTATQECYVGVSAANGYDAPPYHFVLCWGSQPDVTVERTGFGGLEGKNYFINAYKLEFSARPRIRCFAGKTYNIRTKLYYTDLTALVGNNQVLFKILGIDSYNYDNGTTLMYSQNIIPRLLAFLGGWLPTEYNTGSFTSCQSAKLKMIDYNLFDGLTEPGMWTGNGKEAANNRTRIVNPIRVKSSTDYYLKADASVSGLDWVNIIWYDYNMNFLDSASPSVNRVITSPLGAAWLVVFTGQSGGNIDFSSVCIFTYWDGSRIGYEPYAEHIYNLPNQDLNGILTLDGDSNIVADGDEIYPNGEENAKNYYLLNLGNCTFHWGSTSTTPKRIMVDLPSGTPTPEMLPQTVVGNIRSTKYRAVRAPETWGAVVGIAVNENDGMSIYDAHYNDGTDATLAAFKTASNGVYVLYKMATSQDLEASTFAENIYVDDFGTMQFLDENDNQIVGLQGNEVFYKANIAGFAESLYAKTEGDPDDLVVQEDLVGYDKTEGLLGIFGLKSALGGTLRQCLCVKESLTFNNTKVVDMGDLEYVYDSSYQAFRPFNLSDNAPVGDRTHSIVLSTLYETVNAKYSSQLGNLSNMCMCQTLDSSGTNPNIWIKNTSYTDATTFKNAMKGVLLAYEKA